MKKNKIVFVIIILIIILFCLLKVLQICLIDRSGQLLTDGIIFKGEDYYSASYAFTKEGKIIGDADGWEIREIPEDKNHNFLAVRQFTDNFYIVKKSYTIPTTGNIGVVYIDHNRYTSNEFIDAINYLLKEELDEKFYIKTDNISHFAKKVYVGYEDCPVGTKYVGMVGYINDKLVYIQPSKVELFNEQIFCCYVITGSVSETLKQYPYFIKANAEVVYP